MNILDEILAWKRREIEPRLRPVSDRELDRFALRAGARASFGEALSSSTSLSVIAEIKRRSPSAGNMGEKIEASEQARIYYNAGADAISVLTDERYFDGSLQDLWDVTDFLGARQDVRPALRKDFMVHPIQVVEAAEAAARAILIIVRSLSDVEMQALSEAASMAGMESVFEIHDEGDLERALAAGSAIIGVNNRDLERFETSLEVSERLIPRIPDDQVVISESGIREPSDAARAQDAGADAVLIGEALMKTEDPEAFIRAVHGL